ncbi:hypothetical protein [Bacillus toyonensis]|uniref:hypothetical protein n=1 Tax=Bacillus toyonensis TaxID=155322 RepID=UPI001C3EDE67|nr:hypothetical protein [Bacillus toyonensis]
MVNFPLVGKRVKLGLEFGIHDNTYLEKHLSKKGIHLFDGLPDDSLKILASDIMNGRMIIFPDNLDSYGISTDKMLIAKAVRVSYNILFFFKPIKWETDNKPLLCSRWRDS